MASELDVALAVAEAYLKGKDALKAWEAADEEFQRVSNQNWMVLPLNEPVTVAVGDIYVTLTRVSTNPRATSPMYNISISRYAKAPELND